jgi:hypothetical protein
LYDAREITDGYLRMLGVQLEAGRDLLPGDMLSGAPGVTLIGYDYWRRRYGGDPNVIGRTIRYRERMRADDTVVEIVGVLPRSFWPDVKLVLPLRQSRTYQEVTARLRPGTALHDAERALQSPPEGPSGPVRLTSLRDEAELDL